MPQLTVIFLGPQGCGKGTQLKLLTDHLAKLDPARAILHPAMGALLRELAACDTYTSSLLQPVLAEGKLVEYAVSVAVFGNYFLQNLQDNEHILIDGFPRNMDQIMFLDSAMRFYKREAPVVVRIEISDDEAVKRLLARGRSDDTDSGIHARLAWTRKSEKEIEAWFKSNPRYRFVEIDGQHSIEDTHRAVLGALNLA